MPDKGTVSDITNENNSFAPSPGHPSKLLNPSCLGAFHFFGGLVGLEKGLRRDAKRNKGGLHVTELDLESYRPFDASSPHTTGLATPTEPTVRCWINGAHAQAFPDSGANANYISEGEVKRRKYVVDRGTAGAVQLASGSWTSTLGTVDLHFSFFAEAQSYVLRFHVVKRCIQNLIIGSPFLRATKTLTKHWRRITTVFRKTTSCRVRFIGAPRQRLLGFVGGVGVSALPDTGADLSLVSADFVKEHGWEIDSSPEHRIRIEFADGSISQTTGLVNGLSWKFGMSLGREYQTQFYVYEDLECPVILGYGFLCESEAFTRHESSLLWLEPENGDDFMGHLSIIKICSSREDNGRGLWKLLKRKKSYSAMLVGAAERLQTTLPHTRIAFNVDDVLDHRRAERDMLRRREELELKVKRSSDVDGEGLQQQLNQWKDDWDLLCALKPKSFLRQ